MVTRKQYKLFALSYFLYGDFLKAFHVAGFSPINFFSEKGESRYFKLLYCNKTIRHYLDSFNSNPLTLVLKELTLGKVPEPFQHKNYKSLLGTIQIRLFLKDIINYPLTMESSRQEAIKLLNILPPEFDKDNLNDSYF